MELIPNPIGLSNNIEVDLNPSRDELYHKIMEGNLIIAKIFLTSLKDLKKGIYKIKELHFK
jgi:hypothetical protein